jgi:geranylgeranyl transferase type-1 subunit beta
MGHDDLLNEETNQSFLLSSQSPMGGFGKEPGDYPDPYHSYLALAALAIMKTGRELRLGELEVRWNISSKSAQWLRGEIEKLNAK